MNCNKSFAQIEPILKRRGPDHANRLRDFIREFLFIEAAEADLRSALRTASVDLKESEEFKSLIQKGTLLFNEFFNDLIGKRSSKNLEFEVDFIGTLISSFAERTTDEKTSNADLVRQADLLTDMISSYFEIR